jgi:hypothetical protein
MRPRNSFQSQKAGNRVASLLNKSARTDWELRRARLLNADPETLAYFQAERLLDSFGEDFVDFPELKGLTEKNWRGHFKDFRIVLRLRPRNNGLSRRKND